MLGPSEVCVRIHHLALRVADVVRSRDFYSDVLGLRELRRSHAGGMLRSIWLSAGASVLMLERGLACGGSETGSGHLLAFAVDDLDAWQARLEAAGVVIDSRGSATLYFRDPDGHRVGLSVYPFGLAGDACATS
jgi:catechol 2,3-dioxygenase-like lactoylglutathione lyase family enzyme